MSITGGIAEGGGLLNPPTPGVWMVMKKLSHRGLLRFPTVDMKAVRGGDQNTTPTSTFESPAANFGHVSTRLRK